MRGLLFGALGSWRQNWRKYWLPPTITEMRCRPASAPGLKAKTTSPASDTVMRAPLSVSVDRPTVGTGGTVGVAFVVLLIGTAAIVGEGGGLIVAVGRMSFGFGTVTDVDIVPPSSSS